MSTPLWTSAEIAAATGGTASADFAVSGVTFDSREVQPGDLFVAMPGTVHDGHQFVAGAFAAGAAGVHLGDDDLPVLAVRAFAPPPFIIGASLASDADIENARHADYVGIGSVYGTRSKRDAGIPIGIEGLERLLNHAVVPAVGVGGVTPANAGAVMRAGAVGIAAVSALFGADHPAHAARALRSAIGR